MLLIGFLEASRSQHPWLSRLVVKKRTGKEVQRGLESLALWWRFACNLTRVDLNLSKWLRLLRATDQLESPARGGLDVYGLPLLAGLL